ncbi:MAG: hypothetical protein DMG79_18870 [Acidobacteria bacterium]|nr:MAG: hypothetical protein DMG79_18870 [Acidobacteriota bacterium]
MSLQNQAGSGSRGGGNTPSIESIPQLKSPIDVNASQYPAGVNAENTDLPANRVRADGGGFGRAAAAIIWAIVVRATAEHLRTARPLAGS